MKGDIYIMNYKNYTTGNTTGNTSGAVENISYDNLDIIALYSSSPSVDLYSYIDDDNDNSYLDITYKY